METQPNPVSQGTVRLGVEYLVAALSAHAWVRIETYRANGGVLPYGFGYFGQADVPEATA